MWTLGDWERNWLFNVTSNDISVIYMTAHRCAVGLKKKLDLRSGSQRHINTSMFSLQCAITPGICESSIEQWRIQRVHRWGGVFKSLQSSDWGGCWRAIPLLQVGVRGLPREHFLKLMQMNFCIIRVDFSPKLCVIFTFGPNSDITDVGGFSYRYIQPKREFFICSQ